MKSESADYHAANRCAGSQSVQLVFKLSVASAEVVFLLSQHMYTENVIRKFGDIKLGLS